MATQLSSTCISHHSLLPHIPFTPSLHSQQQPLPWDGSTIPKLQLPNTAPSRGSTSLFGVCMAAARTVWFSFYLGCRRSAVSLSALNVSPLTQTIAPMWGSDACFSSPSCQPRASPVLLTLLFFLLIPSSYRVLHPNSFVLPSFAWIYIFFSTGQVLLSALSWCSACTSGFEGVFLMYLERDVLHVHLLLCHLVPLPSFS